MKDYDYAYAVAVIRSREDSLLSKADIDNLIYLPTYKEAIAFLDSKGYKELDYINLNSSLNERALELYEFLKEVMPDIKVFDFLTLKNDFHNLKLSIKSQVMGLHDFDDFLLPSIVEPKELNEAILNKEYDTLPSFLRGPSQEAYELLVSSYDSLLFEALLDKYCLEAILNKAKETKNAFLIEYARSFVNYQAIKVAYRMARSNRDKTFVESYLFDIEATDKDMLLLSVCEGKEAFLAYLGETKYSDLVSFLEVSLSSYEKETQERLLSYLFKTKDNIFGPDAILAYYMAKEVEFMNIRIILLSKFNNIDSKKIEERVRNIYV